MAIPGTTTSEDVYIGIDNIKDGSLAIDIPFPYKQYTDMPFFLMDITDGQKLFIPDRYYDRVTKDLLVFHDTEEIGLTQDSEIKFIFINTENKFHVNKVEYHVLMDKTIGDNTSSVLIGEKDEYEFELPNTPYFHLYNLNHRIQVYYKRKIIINQYSYNIDLKTNKFIVYSPPMDLELNTWFDILCIFSGTDNNYTIQNLPQSGYIFLNKHEIDRNYNTDLMAVFLNGELIEKSMINRISNNIYKINRNTLTRYNLDVKNMSPKINSLVPFYKKFKYNFNIPIQYWYEELIAKITVKGESKKGRKYFDSTVTTTYFDPKIIEKEELYLTLIKRGQTHFDHAYNTTYTIKFYPDDYTEDDKDIYITIELREKQDPTEPNQESYEPLLFEKLPNTITLKNNDVDFPIASVQLKSLVRSDMYNRRKYKDKYRVVDSTNTSNILFYELNDVLVSFICRMWSSFPHKPTVENPIYYEFTEFNNRYQEGNTVGVFEWVISDKINGKGKRYWVKHIDLIPS